MRQFLYLSTLIIASLSTTNSQLLATNGVPQVVTARSQFSIPFRFDQQELTRLNARNVHLFLSRDRGKTWIRTQSADLNQKQFQYKPVADGEYWFSVAISDADEVMHPEPSLETAGLKVIVDRTQPKMKLEADIVSGHQLELNWQITDAHPDVSSLNLEFRNHSDDQWNRVYVKKSLSGKTAWRISQGQFPEIRGRFTDAAGNSIEKIVKLSVPMQKKETPALVSDLYGTETDGKPSVPVQDNNSILSSSETNGSVNQLTPNRAVPDPKGYHQESGRRQIAATDPKPVRRTFQTVSGSYPPTLGAIRYMNSHQFEIEYQIAGVGPSGVGCC